MKKVLVYCPLNPHAPRAYARTLKSIFALDWSEPFEIVFGRDDAPDLRGYDNLTEKHNRARRMALDGGYDALFLVEADMIIPADALTKLADVDADVAYGLYCSRHGSHPWLAFSQIGAHVGRSIDRNRRFCAENWGRIVPTVGVGLGCTLIRRNALDQVTFRRSGSCADDWYFALECQALGLRQAHHLGVVCGHIAPGEGILWPTVTRSGSLHELEQWT